MGSGVGARSGVGHGLQGQDGQDTGHEVEDEASQEGRQQGPDEKSLIRPDGGLAG